MRYFSVKWECGTVDEFEAETIKDLRKQLQGAVEDGDWGQDRGTVWVDVRVTETDEDGEELEDGYEDRMTFTLGPPEPGCVDGEDHHWESPHEILGGLEENPGVWSHGGGVIIKEVCQKCGCLKVTDTWAQRSDTGEQGLQSVRYEEEWLQTLTDDV